jgi:hypothetical protein
VRFVGFLSEDHKLGVFKNMVLRTIFVQKRDKIIGGRRKLHNEEIHKVNSSTNRIRVMKSRRMRQT